MARPKMVHSGVVFAAVTADIGSVAAVTCLEYEFTVAGAKKGHPVVVWCEALEANLAIAHAFCNDNGKVKVRLVNPTAGAIDPASHTYYIVQF